MGRALHWSHTQSTPFILSTMHLSSERIREFMPIHDKNNYFLLTLDRFPLTKKVQTELKNSAEEPKLLAAHARILINFIPSNEKGTVRRPRL